MAWLKNKGGVQSHIYHSASRNVFSKDIMQSSLQPSAYAMLLNSGNFLNSLENCAVLNENEFLSVKKEFLKKNNQKKLFNFLKETITGIALKKHNISKDISNAYLKVALEIILRQNKFMKKYNEKTNQKEKFQDDLFKSISEGRIDSFLSALWHGADLDLKNEKEKTAYELIKESNFSEMKNIIKIIQEQNFSKSSIL